MVGFIKRLVKGLALTWEEMDQNWDVANSFKNVLLSSSTANQEPSVLDTPIDINFGTPTIEETTYVTLSAGGILEFQPAAVGRRFIGRLRFQFTRTSSMGEAHLASWAEISTDSGVMWNAIGDSAIEVLDDANTSQTLYIPLNFAPQNAGEQYRFELARASTDFGSGAGVNNGGLASLDVSADITGAPVSPSAGIALDMINENGSFGGMRF